MKKICFLSGDITRSGGTEKVACQIMSGLANEFKICVLSINELNDKVFFELSSKVERFHLFERSIDGKKDYFRIVHRIRKFIKKKRINILVDIDTILDVFSVPALIGLDTKLISWEHFNFYETLGNKHRMFVRKHITKHSDCVVTLTKEDKNNYNNYFGKSLKVVQIYNPFISEAKDHSYDINSKTIISVGRLVVLKGYDMLVKIADNLLHDRPDWKWLILGDGEEKDNIINDIKKHNLNNVELVGRVDNVNDYLVQSAIFVMTSRNEGFPLSMVEAKAYKLPIVSFNCKTGPQELIRNDVNGNLIDCFDINEMAKKISALMNDSDLRQQYSYNAYLDMEQLEYDRIVNKWVKLINDLLL